MLIREEIIILWPKEQSLHANHLSLQHFQEKVKLQVFPAFTVVGRVRREVRTVSSQRHLELKN